ARGYWNRPELTAERFIPDPFAATPGGRLYKTGDRARFLADGNIEFLGRLDYQVKIRGHRLELGEIEVTLAAHPAVRQCAVVLREVVPGDQRLTAYFVPHPDRAVTPAELRRFLLERLPEYAVPAGFTTLEELPLTPNGKLDRQALPVADAGRAALDEPFLPPRTPTEEALARIWAEVLRVRQVGVHDNFFDLGGHSLLVAQVLARVRQAFEVDLPMRRFFQAPTLAAAATALEELIVSAIDQLSEDEARRCAGRAG
ncbi:MAG: AMP-binding protein, partial [Verrucomicrobia bacterium]|nr:AMP-binding protein [Verrucomicrobiota bacterium]